MSVFVTLWRYRVTRSIHTLGSLAVPAFATIVLCSMRVLFENPPTRAFGLMPYALAAVFGSIGPEASAGRLPLMLTHPARRSTYVLSHWAASATIAGGWALVGLAAEMAALAFLGHGVHAPLAHVVDRLAWCAGVTAVLTAFSARLPSWGHVGLFILFLFLVGNTGETVGPTWKPLFLLLEEALAPTFTVHDAFGTTPLRLSAVARYLAFVSGWLTLAVALFRHREVSYASR